ncbi:MAG: pilus assembly protein N-terminal domain-containing protein [Pseudomonadota bacterium]
MRKRILPPLFLATFLATFLLTAHAYASTESADVAPGNTPTTKAEQLRKPAPQASSHEAKSKTKAPVKASPAKPVKPAAATATAKKIPAKTAPPAPTPSALNKAASKPASQAALSGLSGLSGASTSSSATVSELNLYVGEVKTLTLGRIARVAVGNGKILSATVVDNELLLLTEGVGETSLYLWLKNGQVKHYKVRIYANDVEETAIQAKAILKGIPGISVERFNDTVAIKGQTSKANLARIDAALRNLPKTLNLATEEDVTMKKMIYMKVQIMEFKKSALESLGVQWGTTAQGPALALTGDVIRNKQFRFAPSSEQATFTVGEGARSALSTANQGGKLYLGIATALSSTINLSVNNGDAWILAAPELSTRSGGEAKFLAGGQVPLPSVGSLGQSSVTFKDFGIKLTVRPVADDQGNISAAISTELSDIDPAITVQGIPGFLVRSTDTEVNVQSGQTIVMSGLLDQKASNDTSKFPFLGDLPVLGNLFKSSNFRNGRTDLVIFVTPVVIDPSSTLNQQHLEKAKKLREQFEGYLGKKGIVD